MKPFKVNPLLLRQKLLLPPTHLLRAAEAVLQRLAMNLRVNHSVKVPKTENPVKSVSRAKTADPASPAATVETVVAVKVAVTADPAASAQPAKSVLRVAKASKLTP